MKVSWPGIPEQYWPDTEKPWRVVWGIGAFADFATEDEAQSHGKGEPFNAVERGPAQKPREATE